MARRSSGLSCRLQSGYRLRRRGRHGPCIFGRRPASPPARHVICTFHCFLVRLPMAAGDGPCPTCLVTPLPRLKSLRGCQRRCSRRGRAEASLLTGFVHRSRLCIPPPSLAVAIARRGRVPRPPRRAIHTRSHPPRWGSLYASGSRLATASRRQACPAAEGTLALPGPGRLRFAQTAGSWAFPRMAPRPSDVPLIRTNMKFELRAGGRHTLRGDCLGPPVVFLCPDPERPRFARTHRVLGFP